MAVKRDHFGEALSTIGGALVLFIGLNTFFVIFGVISLEKVLAGASLEPFRLGNTPIPKLQGVSASYLDMLIFCVVGFVTITIGIAVRYFRRRGTLELFRGKGLTDLNKDGQIDNFADEFMDDL